MMKFIEFFKPEGINIYTARNETDGDYRNGIHGERKCMKMMDL